MLQGTLQSLAHALGLGDAPKPGGKRSKDWPLRREWHLIKEPRCRVCGTRKNLNVHHIQPYHLRPDLELDPTNLITLCESTDGGCHLVFGHLCNWKAWNPDIRADADVWRRKILDRP